MFNKNVCVMFIVGIVLSFTPSLASASLLIGVFQIDSTKSFYYETPVNWFSNAFIDPLKSHLEENSNKVGLKGTFDFFQDPLDWWPNHALLTNASVQALTDTDPIFNFPGAEYLVDFDGAHFTGNGNPCSRLGPDDGPCFAVGNFGYYVGDIEGDVLTMYGYAPIDDRVSYAFTVTANKASSAVPEPASMVLFATGLTGAFLRGRQQKLNRK